MTRRLGGECARVGLDDEGSGYRVGGTRSKLTTLRSGNRKLKTREQSKPSEQMGMKDPTTKREGGMEEEAS